METISEKQNKVGYSYIPTPSNITELATLEVSGYFSHLIKKQNYYSKNNQTDENGFFFFSVQQLCFELEIDKKTVISLNQTLNNAGLLDIISMGHRQANKYKINSEGIERIEKLTYSECHLPENKIKRVKQGEKITYRQNSNNPVMPKEKKQITDNTPTPKIKVVKNEHKQVLPFDNIPLPAEPILEPVKPAGKSIHNEINEDLVHSKNIKNLQNNLYKKANTILMEQYMTIKDKEKYINNYIDEFKSDLLNYFNPSNDPDDLNYNYVVKITNTMINGFWDKAYRKK